MSVEFVNNVIGLPWREGAQGPKAYDCWGLARHVQRALFGRDLPLLACSADSSRVDRENIRDVIRALEDTRLRHGWGEVQNPEGGDVCMLSHRRYPSHMGTFLALDHGGILHVTREGGVRFETLPLLRLQGWSRITFFRPHGVELAAPASTIQEHRPVDKVEGAGEGLETLQKLAEMEGLLNS